MSRSSNGYKDLETGAIGGVNAVLNEALGTCMITLALLNTGGFDKLLAVGARATHSAQIPVHSVHSAPLKPLHCVWYRWGRCWAAPRASTRRAWACC